MGERTVTLPELQRVLESARGPQFATIVARTDARLKKTGNPFAGTVWKISRVNGVIGFDYEASVRRQQLRESGEADFQVQARAWGQKVVPTAVLPGPARLRRGVLVAYNEKLYLELKVERVFETRYETDGGDAVTREQVAPFLPKRARGAAAASQGVIKEIILRDYKLDGIRSITFAGTTYTVKP